ncbi:MobA/MobL family protein, partial [Escherichia coli]|nr:MobA/MobL family protein [Escherichia coli]
MAPQPPQLRKNFGDRTANHFAVFVTQPFRAIDKLAVQKTHEVHEVRTYTISTPCRLCAPCGAERKLQKGITAEMAIYHLSMKIISRSSGYSAVASAAYRSGSLMLDERTGLTHDYTRKSGVAEAVILTPATAPAWCTNRAEL